MEANSTGGQGLRRAVAPSDDDDEVVTDHPPSSSVEVANGLQMYLYLPFLPHLYFFTGDTSSNLTVAVFSPLISSSVDVINPSRHLTLNHLCS